MRKIIAIVVASLIPIGMWTAGCRQNNRQAAFPKSAELKGLAKADNPQNKNKPPKIDPAPIDREILNHHDSGALARANAVKDKSKQMSKQKAPNDLFTLPDSGHTMAAAPNINYDPKPADISPANTRSGEFWSRPTNRNGANNFSRNGDIPADVSAMAPAAPQNPDNNLMAPPVQFIPPPAGKQKKTMEPNTIMQFDDVPGIFDGRNPTSMRSGSPPASRKTFNEAFPGGDALGAPPSLVKRDIATKAEKTTTRKSESKGPVKLDLSGLVGAKARETESLAPLPSTDTASYFSTTTTMATTTTTPTSYNGGFMPYNAINPEIRVHAIPGDYEPLPEPIPLEEYQSMLARSNPEPLSSMVARRQKITTTTAAPTLPLPELDKTPARKQTAVSLEKTTTTGKKIPTINSITQPKTEAKQPAAPLPSLPIVKESPAAAVVQPQAVKAADIKKALAPLPDISGKTQTEGKGQTDAIKKTTAPTASSISLPPPLPSKKAELPLATPDLVGAKSTLTPAGLETTSTLTDKDFFKTDFWEKPTAAINGNFDLELPEPKKAPATRKKPADSLGISAEIHDLKKTDKIDAKPAAPATLEPLELTPQPPTWIEEPKKPETPIAELAEMPVPTKKEPPKRIKLQPVRRRDKQLSKIDSEMEVPPMRF